MKTSNPFTTFFSEKTFSRDILIFWSTFTEFHYDSVMDEN